MYLHEICGLNTFDERLEEMSQKAHFRTLFVVFTAGRREGVNTPTSWCPDANRVVPGVREAAKALGVMLLEVEIGTAADYKDEKHMLRVRPEFQPFTGIPMLCAYNGGQLTAKIGTALEKAVSHESAVAVSTEFMQEHIVKVPNPLLCPYVKYGLAAGGLLAGSLIVYCMCMSPKPSKFEGPTQRQTAKK